MNPIGVLSSVLSFTLPLSLITLTALEAHAKKKKNLKKNSGQPSVYLSGGGEHANPRGRT
jgi:hypothetical protein